MGKPHFCTFHKAELGILTEPLTNGEKFVPDDDHTPTGHA